MEWEKKIMTLSRRNFLRTTTMTGLSAVATLGFANLALGQSFGNRKNHRPEIFEVPAEAYNSVLDKINRQMFVGLINSTFLVHYGDKGSLQVYLKDVEDLRPPAFKNNPSKGIECF